MTAEPDTIKRIWLLEARRYSFIDAKLEARVELLEGMAFCVRSGTGYDLVLDTSDDLGGTDRGSTPMELILFGLGGCLGMAGIGIHRQMRQDATGYRIRLTGETAATHPKAFSAIALDHVIRDRGRNPDLVRCAVERSASQYCPAAAMPRTVALTDDVTSTDVKSALTRWSMLHLLPTVL